MFVDDRRCSRCLLPLAACVCADISVVPTRTRVVIVRHIAEEFRSSNSGRLAAMALSNCELLDHGREGAPLDDGLLAAPGTWLVFPEGPPRTVAPAPAPERLVFLDASWRQARRMRQRLPGLRGLPILALPLEPMPAARLRESPKAGLVSTIEAIARGLRLCEGEAPAAALEALFALVVARMAGTGRGRARG